MKPATVGHQRDCIAGMRKQVARRQVDALLTWVCPAASVAAAVASVASKEREIEMETESRRVWQLAPAMEWCHPLEKVVEDAEHPGEVAAAGVMVALLG